ncbi:hypothetical protein B0H13DRAFT_824483 [Mycena leptocephala]|nr:hypothetical protein B0H13DRAFT_824483 [Mycena leptocephala]
MFGGDRSSLSKPRYLHASLAFSPSPHLQNSRRREAQYPYHLSATAFEVAAHLLWHLMHRWNNWKSLEEAGFSAEIRLLDLNTVLQPLMRNNWYWNPDFFDAAVDLFDFLRYSTVPEHRRIAVDQLISCLSQTRDSWEPLRLVLDFVSQKPGVPGERSSYLSPSLSTILGYGPYISNLAATAKGESEPIPGIQFHHQLCDFLRYAHLRSHTTQPVRVEAAVTTRELTSASVDESSDETWRTPKYGPSVPSSSLVRPIPSLLGTIRETDERPTSWVEYSRRIILSK